MSGAEEEDSARSTAMEVPQRISGGGERGCSLERPALAEQESGRAGMEGTERHIIAAREGRCKESPRRGTREEKVRVERL